MKAFAHHNPSIAGTVSTVHVLKTGEIVHGVENYLQVESHFSWVDKRWIVEKILKLRMLTDEKKSSMIVLYEDGHHIKEYVNIDYAFTPLAYC
jgi:D-Tyr-tRNAtyr deacylase